VVTRFAPSPVGLGAKRVTTGCRAKDIIERYSGLARRAMPTT
jgi:hypothetical protein